MIGMYKLHRLSVQEASLDMHGIRCLIEHVLWLRDKALALLLLLLWYTVKLTFITDWYGIIPCVTSVLTNTYLLHYIAHSVGSF